VQYIGFFACRLQSLYHVGYHLQSYGEIWAITTRWLFLSDMVAPTQFLYARIWPGGCGTTTTTTTFYGFLQNSTHVLGLKHHSSAILRGLLFIGLKIRPEHRKDARACKNSRLCMQTNNSWLLAIMWSATKKIAFLLII
jgi:hypothetical protein